MFFKRIYWQKTARFLPARSISTKYPVVRPTQFVTHCVTNWKGKVKPADQDNFFDRRQQRARFLKLVHKPFY